MIELIKEYGTYFLWVLLALMILGLSIILLWVFMGIVSKLYYKLVDFIIRFRKKK